MAIISLLCYNSSIFFLGFLVIDTLASLINSFPEKNTNNALIKAEQYIFLFSFCISDLLSGFLVIITMNLMKSSKTEKIRTNIQDAILLRRNNNDDKNKKIKKYLLLFGICLIDLIGRSCSFVYYLLFEDKIDREETIGLFSSEMIFRTIFSQLILKTKLYKHHYMSIIIIIIGYLPLLIFGIVNLVDWKIIIFFLLRCLAFSIGDNFTKLLFTKEFLLPQDVMLYKGFFALLIHCFVLLPIFFSNQILSFGLFFDYIRTNKLNKLLKTILLILCDFLRNIFILQIIYLFSPIHIGFLVHITKYIGYILPFFFDGWNERYLPEPKIMSLIIYILLFVFIIFGTLVFSEIIVINKCGLNEHTKPGLLEKLKLDRASLDSERYEYNEEEEESETN